MFVAHLPVHCAACDRVLSVPHTKADEFARFRPVRAWLRVHELFRHAA